MADSTNLPTSIPVLTGEEPIHRSHPVHIDLFNHEGKSYRTTVSRAEELSLTTEVYDSSTCEWTAQGELPMPVMKTMLQAVCCKANYFEIAAVIMKKVERLTSSSDFNPLRIHQFQCQYVSEKLTKAVKYAQEYVLSDATSEHILQNVGMKLCQVAEEVERIVLDCCTDQWLQAAVATLTGFTEQLSSLVFELELCSTLLRKSHKSHVEGIEMELDVVSTNDNNIMKEKAAADWEAVLAKINSQTGSSHLIDEEKQLADYVVKRWQMYSKNICHDEDTWRVEYKSLRREGKIGRGASASVYTTLWCGVHLAEKCYSVKDTEEVKHEVSVLSRLSHSNIVSLVCYAMGPRQCSLVMEKMDGDLHNLMEGKMEESGTETPFELFEALHIIRQIAEGMHYIHDNRIIHRDLKSGNVLVKFGSKALQVKVADFGLSKVKEMSRSYSAQTKNRGTTRWMAPELLSDQPKTDEMKHHFKCDVYSFGMVCFEILSGSVPYEDIQSQKKVRKLVLEGARPTIPEKCPEDLAELIRCCWNADPSTRPSFSSICLTLRNLHFAVLTEIMLQPSLPLEIDHPIFQYENLPIFIKCAAQEPLPLGYHLATIEDVHMNRDALLSAMPKWEIASLVDGWVDGAEYGGCSGPWNDGTRHVPNLGHKGGILCFYCMKAFQDQDQDHGELTTLKGLISRLLRKNNSQSDLFISRLSISDSFSESLSYSDLFYSCLTMKDSNLF